MYIFTFIFLTIIIISGLMVRRRGRGSWARRIGTVSAEDFIAQMFLVISIFFVGISLFAFNREMGSIVDFKSLILITVIVAWLSTYYFRSVYGLLVALFGTFIWWSLQSYDWAIVVMAEGALKPASILAGLVMIAVIFYLLGTLHWIHQKFVFAGVYNFVGVIFLTIVLFFFSTQFGLETLSSINSGLAVYSSPAMLIFLTAMGLIIAFLGGKLILSRKTPIWEVVFLWFISGLFLYFTIDPTPYSITGNVVTLNYFNIIWAVLFNLLVLIELLGLVLTGYLNQQLWRINLGVFLLFILMIVKYMDWFFTFLDKSLFFISAGLLFLVVGWLMERGRRYLIASIEKGETKNEKSAN